MFYPEEFKKKVKEMYPDHKSLHKLLEYGDRKVGKLLLDQCPVSVPIQRIREAETLEELKEIADDQDKKFELYREWLNLDHANQNRIYHS